MTHDEARLIADALRLSSEAESDLSWILYSRSYGAMIGLTPTDRRNKMDKKAQTLDKVRKLLAKASGGTTEAEAAALREKADELMSAYAIEAWMVEEGAEETRPKPEVREMDCSWYYRHDRGSDLWQLLHVCANAARCKLVWWKSASRAPIIGLPADLDYMDLLFTQLMLELTKRIEPEPDPALSVEENGYRLRASGCRWPKAAELLYGIGQLSPPKSHLSQYGFASDARPEWSHLPTRTREAIKNTLAQKCRKYRRENGLEDYTEVHPEVYARSFAQGFYNEIDRRFRELRRRAEEPSGEDNSKALALLDIRQVIDNEALDLFGEPPESKEIEKSQAFDYGAYRRGAIEGRNVDLAAHPQRGLRGTKELPR